MIKCFILLIVSFQSFALGMEFYEGFGAENPLLAENLTVEDAARYEGYEQLYKNLDQLKATGLIPKNLHFIWLGPYQPPKLYQDNILSWIALHPDWQVYLWTDRPIKSFHSRLEHRLFQSHLCEDLEDLYIQTHNYSERAAFASYAVLKQQGGVYIDCDVECFQPIDVIASQCDFFCPVDFCTHTCLSSSINVGKHVLGAAPHHPILEDNAQKILKNWSKYTNAFQGDSKEADLYRLKYRVVWPLSQSVLEVKSDKSRLIALPPLFFKTIGKKQGLFGHHHQLHTVESTQPSFEEKLSKKIDKLTKRSLHTHTVILWSFLMVAGFQLLSIVKSLLILKTRARK